MRGEIIPLNPVFLMVLFNSAFTGARLKMIPSLRICHNTRYMVQHRLQG